MEHTTSITGTYIEVALSSLVESTTNPRTEFDTTAIEELAASIKEQGLLQPILVRPVKKGKYEVVAGARRLRACKLAELENVTVHVRNLSDEKALEIQIIENLQRKDINPMDEAAGFARLLTLPGYTVAEIAQRVGKSDKYVAQRVQLMKLIPGLQEKFFQGKLLVGHALHLARLSESFQEEFLNTGFFHTGHFRYSVPELQEQIAERLMKLSAAPWKKDDATLVPEAGSCQACRKRTGYDTTLFHDLQDHDRCTDRACWDSKAKAAMLIKQQEVKKEEGKCVFVSSRTWLSESDKKQIGLPGIVTYSEYDLVDKKKPCDSQEKAVMADGSQAGHVIHICRNKQCKVHHPYNYSNSSSSGRVKADEDPEKFYADKIKTGRQNDTQAVRERVFAALDGVLPYSQVADPEYDLRMDELRLLAYQAWDALDSSNLKRLKAQGLRDAGYINTMDIVDYLKSLSKEQLYVIIRRNLFLQFKDRLTDYSGQLLVEVARNNFWAVDIAAIEAEQDKIREKREKRINELKAEKLAALKKTEPAAEEKPSKKKKKGVLV